MSTITISDSVDAIMRELSYQDTRQALKDSLTTEILARISSYKSEVMHFNERYGKPFDEIVKECRSKDEDFSLYDDIMAWEFAIEGMAYWENKLKELHRDL